MGVKKRIAAAMNITQRSHRETSLNAYPAMLAARITVPANVSKRFIRIAHITGLPPSALSNSNSGRSTNA